MSARRKKSIHQTLLPVLFQQRGGQPSGLISVQVESHLPLIARPLHMSIGRTWTIVGKYHAGRLLTEVLGIPKVPGGQAHDRRCGFDG